MKALPVFLAAFLLASGAWGQSTVRPLYVVVTSCGTAPSSLWTAGSQQLGVQDVNGNVCVNASVTASASITGFPGASPTTGTPIAVTTSAVTGTLPAGTVVVASNVGTTNNAYCKLGATATTSDQLIPPNSWFAFTVGAATQLTCITSTSTTTVNMVGGSGLPTGSGGGGGGSGSGGAVTIADGANTTQGAKADAKSTATDTTPITIMSVLKQVSASVQAIATSIAGSLSVTGTFWQATQPVSMAAVPTGGSTSANQTSQITQETATAAALGTTADAVCGTATGTCTLQALIKFLNNAAASAIPAGANLIGNTGTLYPAGSTPITASATGTTAATTATLAGTAAKSTYLCGFSIRANATAAATANSTVTGTVTGTLNFTQWTAPLASGIGLTEQIFSPCIIASATNTGIAVISAAPGTGGVVSVSAWGFQL